MALLVGRFFHIMPRIGLSRAHGRDSGLHLASDGQWPPQQCVCTLGQLLVYGDQLGVSSELGEGAAQRRVCSRVTLLWTQTNRKPVTSRHLALRAPPVTSHRSPVAQGPEPLVPRSSVLIQSLLHWALGLAEEGSLLSPALLSVQGRRCPWGSPPLPDTGLR